MAPYGDLSQKSFYETVKSKNKAGFEILLKMMAEIEQDNDLNHLIIPDMDEFNTLTNFSSFKDYLDATVKDVL
jgi:hypothetical protein